MRERDTTPDPAPAADKTFADDVQALHEVPYVLGDGADRTIDTTSSAVKAPRSRARWRIGLVVAVASGLLAAGLTHGYDAHRERVQTAKRPPEPTSNDETAPANVPSATTTHDAPHGVPETVLSPQATSAPTTPTTGIAAPPSLVSVRVAVHHPHRAVSHHHATTSRNPYGDILDPSILRGRGD